MRDDNDDWDGDEDFERASERDAELRSAFMELQFRHAARMRLEQNELRARQLDVTLLELHIHELVEDEIQKNSFLAAASDLEAQELLQRVSKF